MNVVLNMAAQSGAPDVIRRLLQYVETADQSVAQQQVADPDYWSTVGIITLAGLFIVFMILAILILLFYGLGAVFKAWDKKKAQKAAQKAAEKAAAPASEQTEALVVEDIADDDDEEEIIAVISAAISAYAAHDGTSYTIRSIKRKGSGRSAWSMAGINANMRQF